MELRFTIHDSMIAGLQERTGIDCATDLARDGLRLLEWATLHVSRGHDITCVSETRVHDIPNLDSIMGARSLGKGVE